MFVLVMLRCRWGVGLVAAAAALTLSSTCASADTLVGALTQAYKNNPQLNAQRAAVRVSDEAVPQALSGYRPRVSLTASIGSQYLDTLTKSSSVGAPATYSQT